MAPRNRKSRRQTKRVKRRSHSRRQRGGAGSGYEPDGRLAAEAPYAMVNKAYDGCAAVTRPGAMGFSSSGGLPGMRGGAYTNNLSSPIAGFAQIDKVGCQANAVNPLNQRGGAGLVGASDMGVYEAQGARYTSAPSQWTGSTGAPVLLNPALDTKMWSRACTQTGGLFRKKSAKKSRKSKKSKQSRKSKKSRRGSRKY
jgi:hypothetical protein